MKETFLCLRRQCVCVFPRHVTFSCDTLLSAVGCSACGSEVHRIEEMEKMLKEAQHEKARLMENRVSSGSTLDITSSPVSQLSVALTDGSINNHRI